MVPLSLLLGTLAAMRAGRTADHGISLTALGLQALPEFVVGSLLIVVFFTWLDLLPPVALIPPGESPLSHPKALVLPVLTLLAATLAGCTRMVRAGMVETLRSDYVQMARLNGLPERRVVSRYALRNALAPAIQVFAQNIQYLFGGIIIVEYLFAYPGLGKELVDAVAIRDVREVQSIAILIAAFYIFVNIVADLLVVLRGAEAADRQCVSGCASRAPAPAWSARSLLALVARASRSSGRSSRRIRSTQPIGTPYERPSADAWLGTDFLGRDVLVARALGRAQRARAGRARDAARLRRRPRDRPRRRVHALAARPAADAVGRRADLVPGARSSCSCW